MDQFFLLLIFSSSPLFYPFTICLFTSSFLFPLSTADTIRTSYLSLINNERDRMTHSATLFNPHVLCKFIQHTFSVGIEEAGYFIFGCYQLFSIFVHRTDSSCLEGTTMGVGTGFTRVNQAQTPYACRILIHIVFLGKPKLESFLHSYCNYLL